MAEYFDVTSANAQLVLACETIYPSGVQLNGFSTDSVMSSDPVDRTEARQSVDGRLVAGVIYNPQPVAITLEANSPSLEVFETIRDAMAHNKKPYALTLTVVLPALDKTVVYRRGVLVSGPTIPALGRTLQPTTWTMQFQEVA